MTARELRRRFPKASEAFVFANANPADELTGLAPEAQIEALAPNVAFLSDSVASAAPAPEFRLLVTLPIPSRKLSPNGRAHHMAKAREVRAARLTAMLASLAALPSSVQPKLAKATLQLTWYHPTKRLCDASNLIGWCKAYEDGICDSGVIANDVGITWLPPIRLTDRNEPRVEILITAP